MRPDEQPEELKMEVVSAVQAMTHGEIKSQVEIAHQFPRSMARFLKVAEGMATVDEDTAMSCLYRRPIGKDDSDGGGQKMAEGMSIRMAEIVGASYGNLRVQTTTIFQDERKVTVRGTAHDLESNFAASAECSESTVKRNGQPYSERQRILMEKVAHAKAFRDSVFKVVPRALAKPIEAAVKRILIGDAKTLEKRRAAVKDWIDKMGIDPIRIFAALKIAGYPELGPEQLETLTGLRTAIKDGDETFDSAFPPVSAKGGQNEPTQPRQNTQTPPKAESPAGNAAPEAPIRGQDNPQERKSNPSAKSESMGGLHASDLEKLTNAVDTAGISAEIAGKVLVELGFLEEVPAGLSVGQIASKLTPHVVSNLLKNFAGFAAQCNERIEGESGLAPANVVTMPPTETAKPAASEDSDLDLLRRKLSAGGVLEDQLIRNLTEAKKVLAGTENLEAVAEMNPALIKWCVVNFEKLKASIQSKSKK